MKNLFRFASLTCASLVFTSLTYAAQTFTITQEKPQIQHVDVGTPGMSHGDILAFEASFTAKDGKKGIMSGLITTVSLPTGAGDEFLDRIGTIVFDFGSVDSLVITGKSLYGSSQNEMKDQAPQIRAITGGTGRFIGARGQVTTTRHANGLYEHEIQLVD